MNGFEKDALVFGLGVFYETEDNGKYLANLDYTGKVLSKYDLSSKIKNSPTEHQVAVENSTLF
jgi:hypothetical protein